jgi:hypothetical protein
MSPLRPVHGDEPFGNDGLELLFNLVYCSRAAAGVDAAQVDRIIETSRRNNPLHGITGLLVFGSGIFFQWLEGPRQSVLRLMALIEKDPRHQAVVVLDSDEELRERLFASWDMEPVDAEDLRSVLRDALDNARQPGSAQVLRDMLQQLESGDLGRLGRG